MTFDELFGNRAEFFTSRLSLIPQLSISGLQLGMLSVRLPTERDPCPFTNMRKRRERLRKIDRLRYGKNKVLTLPLSRMEPLVCKRSGVIMISYIHHAMSIPVCSSFHTKKAMNGNF